MVRIKSHFKNRFLSGTALVGLGVFVFCPSAAFATCDINNPISGQTVTCDSAGGTDSNGVINPAADNVTVNFINGGAITRVGAGILLNDNIDINVTDGDVNSTGSVGVAILSSGSVTLNNSSTILSLVSDAVTIGATGSVDLSDAGTSIQGAATGIAFTGAGNSAVTVGGTLTGSGGTAVDFGATDAAFTLLNTANINGDVVAAGGGSDEFILGGGANGSFDTTQIGTKYQNFDSFAKSGASTWTLTGNNAQDWAITAGTLEATVNNIDDAAVSAGATLLFTSGGTYGGDVSGAGGLTKSGGAALRINGTNTFSGPLTVENNTTLIVDNAAALGNTSNVSIDQSTFQFNSAFATNRAFTIGANDASFDTNGFNDTISGNIGGAGTLVKTGNGTLSLIGTNTYAGGVIINQGRLTGTTDSIIGDVTNNGTLRFDQIFDATFSDDIIGTGALEKTGAGIVTLSGNNTYQGGTNIFGSTTLRIMSGASLGDSSGDVTIDQSTLAFGAAFTDAHDFIIGANDATFDTGAFNDTMSGNISGATGKLIKAGTGTLTLTGTNTYGDGTTISAGILAGNTSSLQGNVLNNATLQFDQAGVGTFGGGISGTGALIKNGAGNLTLNNNNTYTGLTTINDGILSVSASNNLGNGAASNDIVLNGGTLRYLASFNQARDIALNGGTIDTNGFDTLLSGVISGASDFTKEGGGTITLSGNNTFTGDVNVTGGILAVSANNNLGNAANDLTLDGGTFQYSASFNSARDITLGAGDGTINTNGNNTTLSGVIDGAGKLIKTGGGTLTLSGTNTYLGGTDVINASTLNVSSDANLGDASGDVHIDFSTFQYGASFDTARNFDIGAAAATIDTQAFNSTISGDLSGTGQFVKQGAGTLTLTGDSTKTGGFLVGGGTLVGDTGNLTGNITNNASLRFDQAANGTYAGVLSGTGTLHLDGSGEITLSGVNTYSGITHINDGLLIVSASSNLGNGAGTNDIEFNGGDLQFGAAFNTNRDIALTDDATIDTNNFNTTLSGVVSGTGDLTKDGTGQMTLSGVNTYSGRTFIIGGGTVAVSADSGLGDGSATNDITINSSTLRFTAGGFTMGRDLTLAGSEGTLNIDGAFAVTMSGVIDGVGDLVKDGAGDLILTGTNTYTGNTIIDAGLLVGDTDSIKGDVTNDAALEFDQAADGTFAGDIGGTGSFEKTGAGNLTLSGTNTYTGGTTVTAGTLTGTTTSLQGAIDNDGNVVFDQAANGTYAGVLTGNGFFTKNGAGNLILTGNSGAWAGSTDLNTGRLSVNGALGSAINVGAAGTLGGNGTIGAAIVDGTFAPGNSIDQINVLGNVDFNNGSHFEVEYDPATSDRVDVGGAVTINAGAILDLIGLGGTYAATTGPYTILTAVGGVAGTFGTVNNNLAFLDADVDYNANDIQLTLTRNDIAFDEVARDEQQADVAQAVEDLGPGNDLHDAFTGLTEEEARDALDDVSGEHNAGVAGAMAQTATMLQTTLTSHMSTLTHGAQNGDLAALAPAKDPSVYVAALLEPAAGPMQREINFWMEAIGSFGDSHSHGPASQQDRHSYGALAGVDVAFDDAGHYGIFGGYEIGEVETDSQGASSELNNYHLGAFVTRPLSKEWTLSGGVAATYHDIDSTRYVVFPGFSAAPQGETTGYTASTFIEAAHAMQFDEIAIEPFANVSLTYSHMDGYTETNGGSANLAVDSVSNTIPATTLGIRAGKAIKVDDKAINLNVSFGWQHVYGNTDNETEMRFAAGTTTFDAFGPARDRDAALIGIGVDAKVGHGTTAYAGYNGMLSANSQDHGFRAGLKIKF